MVEKTIGDLLRENRVKSHLTLSDIEERSGIPSHYLLALELDQFTILPSESVESCLLKYANLVGLSPETILAKYRGEKETPLPKEEPKQAVTPEVTFPDKAEVPQIAEEPEAPVVSVTTEEEKASEEDSSEKGSYKPITGTRSSRYRQTEPSKGNSWPIVVLSAVAAAILAFVAYTVWTQTSQGQKTTASSYSVTSNQSSSSSSTASSSTSESSSSQAPTITTEGSGNQLMATISGATAPVEVSISYSGQSGSWVSVTNTEAGSTEATLNSANPTLTANLASGTTSSVITLGMTEGISITINGQTLDMSALTVSDLTYITLTIQ